MEEGFEPTPVHPEQPPPPSAAVPAPNIPALQTQGQIVISWLCLAGLVGFLALVAALFHIPPPETHMQEPGRYLLHTSGKSLEAVEALEASGGIFAAYRSVSTSVSSDALESTAKALDAWTEPGKGVPAADAKNPQLALRALVEGIDRSEDLDALRLLAIVQFERGETEAAVAAAERLNALGDDVAARRIHAAFGGPAFEPPTDAFVPVFTPHWAETIVMQRAAERRGDHASAKRQETARRDAGAAGAWSLLLIDGGMMVLSLLGLVFILFYAIKRPDLTCASGFSKPPWSPAEAFGVIARGGFTGMLMGQCCCGLIIAASAVGFPIATLMMGIPSLAFGIFYLHRPHQIDFFHTFGLVGVRWPKMLAVTFACLCATYLLQTVVSVGAASMGHGQHWAEAASVAPLVTGNWFDAANVALAVSICAPVGEELLFRAYLYSALRTKFGPWTSILLSAAVFGVVHPYSLVGLIAVGTSGFVWAFAYEKTRSLWPALLCHALMNGSITILHLGLYR